MNRAFKTIFHNGEADEKAIVTMSCTVNNGKRFGALDEKGRKSLIGLIELFQRQLGTFKDELLRNHYGDNQKKQS